MSKSTKVIAALGVAAGLGIAALPAASFAATTQDVPLTVTVPDVLDLEIGSQTGDFITDTTDGIELTPAAGDMSSSHTLTAKANGSSTGWNITVASTDTESHQETSTLYNAASGGDSIAPYASEKTTAQVTAAATTGWGIKLANAISGNTSPSVFTTTGYSYTEGGVVFSGDSPTITAGVTGTVGYGVSVADGAPSGTYKGSITYTIANNQ